MGDTANSSPRAEILPCAYWSVLYLLWTILSADPFIVFNLGCLFCGVLKVSSHLYHFLNPTQLCSHQPQVLLLARPSPFGTAEAQQYTCILFPTNAFFFFLEHDEQIHVYVAFRSVSVFSGIFEYLNYYLKSLVSA